jgi:hypothetical protein
MDSQPPRHASCIGAIVDTGCQQSLSIQASHLGLNDDLIREYEGHVNRQPIKVSTATQEKVELNRVMCDLWIISNLHTIKDGMPLALRVPLAQQGIACYPEGKGPRVPTLGVGTLLIAGITMVLKYGIIKGRGGCVKGNLYLYAKEHFNI